MSGNGNGVGTFAVVAFDCPDPKALAEFYSGVIGGKPEGEGEWVTLQGVTDVKLAFQQADDWSPPAWPGAEHPQQAHIDVEVHDLEEAERQVLALGARKADHQPGGKNWQVFLDPAGHPFCLCAC